METGFRMFGWEQLQSVIKSITYATFKPTHVNVPIWMFSYVDAMFGILISYYIISFFSKMTVEGAWGNENLLLHYINKPNEWLTFTCINLQNFENLIQMHSNF